MGSRFRDEWAADAHRADEPRVLSLAAFAERSPTRVGHSVVAADISASQGVAQDDPRRVVIGNGVDEDDLRWGRRRRGPTASCSPMSGGCTASATQPGPSSPRPARRGGGDRRPPSRGAARRLSWLEDSASCWTPRSSGSVTSSTGAQSRICLGDRALLYIPGASLAPSGKLFEYLASGRPASLPCAAREPG